MILLTFLFTDELLEYMAYTIMVLQKRLVVIISLVRVSNLGYKLMIQKILTVNKTQTLSWYRLTGYRLAGW